MNKRKVVIFIVITVALLICTSLYSRDYIIPIVDNVILGQSNPNIKLVQQNLKNWGYYQGEIDGVFGLETFNAVRDFQYNYGFFPSGFLNAHTSKAMGLTKLTNSDTVFANNRVGNVQILARAINGEARGEPYKGQVAVAAVILNRTLDSKFPKTIAGVIYQPGAFTAVSDGQINVPIDPKSTVVKAAQDALNGWDPTSGCIYYWNPATATSKWIWTRSILTKIGKHNFGK